VMGQPLQFEIDQGQQPVKRRLVTSAPIEQ
jgi:hypothetical protein